MCCVLFKLTVIQLNFQSTQLVFESRLALCYFQAELMFMPSLLKDTVYFSITVLTKEAIQNWIDLSFFDKILLCLNYFLLTPTYPLTLPQSSLHSFYFMPFHTVEYTLVITLDFTFCAYESALKIFFHL